MQRPTPEYFVIQPIHEDGTGRRRQTAIAPRQAEAVVRRHAGSRAQEVDSSPRLRVMCNHGAGLSTSDWTHNTALGMPMIKTLSAGGRSVAKHAVALMLVLAHRMVDAAATLPAAPNDGAALAASLHSRRIGGAALDVYCIGPPLRNHATIIATLLT